MEIKEGTQVRIRTWESLEAEYGIDEEGFIPVQAPSEDPPEERIDSPIYFAPGMKRFCGKIGTVEDYYVIGNVQQLLVSFPETGETEWLFTPLMVEEVLPSPSDPEILNVDLAAMVGNIGVDETS